MRIETQDIDDATEPLRARIWMRYGVELHELIREQRSPPTDAHIDDVEGGF